MAGRAKLRLSRILIGATFEEAFYRKTSVMEAQPEMFPKILSFLKRQG
jgi:hypothetical protein